MAGEKPLQPKLIKRFYEALVLLRVVSQVQGSKIKTQYFEAESLESVAEVEMRRRVMHCLCEMCDFIKGGTTVTAMAAENVPNGPRYWIATNGFLEKIETFLSRILKMLEFRASSRPHKADTLSFEGSIVQAFVQFQRPRIKQYQKQLRTNIKQELNRVSMSSEHSIDTPKYENWLHSITSRCADELDLAKASDAAYRSRHSSFLRVDFDPIIMQPATMESNSRRDIRHCVGRLCAPIRAARLLTFASVSHPYLFQGFTLLPVEPGTPYERPSAYPGLTLDGISNRMFSNEPERLAIFREALQLRDQKCSVIARICEHYQGTEWKPRIHAELALLEALYGAGCTFYQDDRYIACSKAACFCCYHYICHHPGSFVTPPSHNKVYINWSPPHLPENTSGSRLLQHRDTMNRLIEQVRWAVVDQVLTTQSRMRWHPDSSTGITPLLAVDASIKGSICMASQNSPQGEPKRSDRTDPLDEAHSTASSEDGGIALN